MNSLHCRDRFSLVQRVIILLVGTGALWSTGSPVQSSTIPVVTKDGTIKAHMTSIELDQAVYVSANDVAEILHAKLYWVAEKKKLDLKFGGHRLTLTVSNSVVLVDREAFHLPRETVYRDGAVWVPVRSLCELLTQAVPGWLEWEEETNQLKVLSTGFNVTNMSIESKSNGTLITIGTTETFSVDHSLGPSNWLNVTILGGRLDPEVFQSASTVGHVRKVRAYQFSESCQISFHLSKTLSNYKVVQSEEPREIVILLRQPHGDQPSIINRKTSPDELKPNQTLAIFDLIVLDAGHGGKDPGAIGPTGLKEKNVVLDVTKRLTDLLRKHLGMKVILTRDDDSYVSLHRRTEIANSTGADIFVSLHANASRRQSVGGCETFFLSPAKNDEARAVAMRENAALKFDEESGLTTAELSDEDFILRDIVSDMLQSSFLKESESLAGFIQTDMEKKLDIKNRGVDQAGFFVLVGAKMPAVLIEIAFISNTYEEKLLKQRWFRQKIAESIFEGIKRFKNKYESRL